MNLKRKKEKKEMKKHEEAKHDPVEKPAGETLNTTAPEPGNDQGSGEAGLTAQLAELNDRYLRLYSEFDNYRKRTLKEKLDQSKFASADIITRLLPVLDDFERGIKAFDLTGETNQAFKDGLVLIFNKFLTILIQQGLEQMKTIGEPFDTDFHEAITNIPAPEPEMVGKVVDEIEKGYLLGGKVIRYAKVVVGN